MKKIAAGPNYSLFQNKKGDIFRRGDPNIKQNINLDIQYLCNLAKKLHTVFENASHIVQFCCGNKHSLFLDREAFVFLYRLPEVGNCLSPEKIEGIPPIKAISCGNESSYLLDNYGNLWSFGENFHGELGQGNSKPNSKPTKIIDVGDINQISQGNSSHVIVTNSKNSIFIAGDNSNGQLVGNNAENKYESLEEIELDHSNVCKNKIISSPKKSQTIFELKHGEIKRDGLQVILKKEETKQREILRKINNRKEQLKRPFSVQILNKNGEVIQSNLLHNYENLQQTVLKNEEIEKKIIEAIKSISCFNFEPNFTENDYINFYSIKLDDVEKKLKEKNIKIIKTQFIKEFKVEVAKLLQLRKKIDDLKNEMTIEIKTQITNFELIKKKADIANSLQKQWLEAKDPAFWCDVHTKQARKREFSSFLKEYLFEHLKTYLLLVDNRVKLSSKQIEKFINIGKPFGFEMVNSHDQIYNIHENIHLIKSVSFFGSIMGKIKKILNPEVNDIITETTNAILKHFGNDFESFVGFIDKFTEKMCYHYEYILPSLSLSSCHLLAQILVEQRIPLFIKTKEIRNLKISINTLAVPLIPKVLLVEYSNLYNLLNKVSVTTNDGAQINASEVIQYPGIFCRKDLKKICYIPQNEQSNGFYPMVQVTWHYLNSNIPKEGYKRVPEENLFNLRDKNFAKHTQKSAEQDRPIKIGRGSKNNSRCDNTNVCNRGQPASRASSNRGVRKGFAGQRGESGMQRRPGIGRGSTTGNSRGGAGVWAGRNSNGELSPPLGK